MKPEITSLLDSPCDFIAGVDEAGRGPLAGPVAVAAVILARSQVIPGLNDSKRLTASQRETLYLRITQCALAWHVEKVDVDEIDRLNILQATLGGMRRAIEQLHPKAQYAYIDGNQLPSQLPCQARAIIGGDRIEPAIMAASILAKVSRDRWMHALHQHYPAYGFDRHKGYGTAAHLAALATHGPCPHHRRSFAPVRQWYVTEKSAPE